MMGEAHERTIITRERTVKNLHLASGFSAIRTRSEERLRTVNGELARAISKFYAYLLIFLCNKPEIDCDFTQLLESGCEAFDAFMGEDAGGRVRLSDSSRLSSLTQKVSRLALSSCKNQTSGSFPLAVQVANEEGR